MCLFALITPPHPPHFCWSLWKQQPLTLGDVWVQVEDVWWLRQPLLHEHCALFLAASLMGFSSRPNLDHRTPTGVYCSYHCKWIQRKVWECCTNLLTPLHQNYLFFLYIVSTLQVTLNDFSWKWKQFKANEHISSSSLLPSWQNMSMYQIEKVQRATCQESFFQLSNKSLLQKVLNI